MATIAELTRRLDRGLDSDTQNPAHDELWLSLLVDYEAAVDGQRQTCLRRDHVGAQLDAEQEGRGRWTDQRLGGIA